MMGALVAQLLARTYISNRVLVIRRKGLHAPACNFNLSGFSSVLLGALHMRAP